MNDSEAGTSGAVTEDFNVFLNHRGPDVKATFVAHLEEALRCAGFRPFLDARSLMKGNPALKSIDQALDMAEVHVAVVSRRYAESKYCLNELVAMMRSGKPVIPVFYDIVEPVDLRWMENGPFAEAFEKHKLKGRTQKKLQEWRDALRALSELTGFRLADYKRDEAQLKREVVNAVARLTPSYDPVEVEEHRVGLEDPTKSCIQMLDNMGSGTGILGLVGMGGVGKTTLAREIYNHFVAEKKFRYMTFLEIHRDSSSSNVQVRPTWSRKLRKQLLWDLLSVHGSTSNYSSWFRKVSTLGPVFIVIDDVYKLGQFEELIPSTSLLHPGSRILVTSRDRNVLKCVSGKADLHQHLFDVSTLRPNDSYRLFNWHAFHAKEAPEDCKDLAKNVVEACGGLPLALKVIGSSLFDKRSDEDRENIWPEAVDALRQSTDVMGVLRWSYDNLPDSEKLMFLDITCLFCYQSANEAFAYWEGCKSCTSGGGVKTPHMSLRNLVDKNMISEDDKGFLQVHELLRDLGQEIGRKGKSHLICDSVEDGIAMANQGTKKTVALNLARSWKRKFEAKSFAKMSNLQGLILPNGCKMNGKIRCTSKELRLLQWRHMPFICLPMELNLFHMSSLDFSYSTNLASLWTKSNVALEGCPNLHRLNLEGCTSITKLPDSIGQSSQLQHLNLKYCKSLKELPESIGQPKALKELNLIGCSSLKALPDSIGALSNLQNLLAWNCDSLVKLPTSIGLLSSLQWLSISTHAKFQVLSDGNIGEAWTRLRQLLLTNCGGLGSLLLNCGALKSLEFLDLCNDSALIELPESLGLLVRLSFLVIQGCERLQIECLPKSVAGLKMLQSLYLGNCKNLKRLPKNLGVLTSLQDLTIWKCPIRRIPKSIGLLSQLHELRVVNCKNFQKLPTSIKQLKSLRKLKLEDCGRIEAMGALTPLQGIHECGSLKSLNTLHLQDSTLTELPESLGLLIYLQTLNIICERLQCLPESLGDLKMIENLELSHCDNLKRLPENMGELTSLKTLSIKYCPVGRLPKSMGLLSQLQELWIWGCKNLQKLPSFTSELKSLKIFVLQDCGSIEALGALTALQGLPLWGSTSITKLPASLGIVSTLIVHSRDDNGRWRSAEYRLRDAFSYGTRLVLEEDDSGFLDAYHNESSGLTSLLRGVRKK